MGLRDRVRKTFKKKDAASTSGGSTPSTASDPSHYTGRTDIEYYKPHEIPKPKYKGRVDPEHKERLDSYSFADAFTTVRRKSSQALSGIMSPGGTESQSRRPSYMSHMSQASKERRGSIAAHTSDPHDYTSPPMKQGASVGQSPASLIRENSDDDTNVANTGLSRRGTAKLDRNYPLGNVPEVKVERQASVQDQSFTASDLEQAMTRATLRAGEQDAFKNSAAIAAH